jgi:hypothetical protein
MKTATPVLAQTPALARGELTVLAVLVLAGIGGGVAAQRNLAERRSGAAAEAQSRAAALRQAQADGARLGRESDLLLTRLKGIVAGPQAPSVSPTAIEAGAAAEAGGRTGAPLAVRLTALNHLADLVQKGVLSTQAMSTGALLGGGGLSGQKLPAYMIDGQGKLAPGFGELFGLSDGEVARFQAVVSDLKQRADEFVLNHTVARPVENGYVLEYVPAEGMAEARDAGLAALKSILGEERYRIFAVLNGERTGDNGTVTGGPAALFEAAGNTPRTITLTRTPTGVSYTMTSGPNGARVANGSMGGGDLGAVLTSRFGPTAHLLPQDFLDSIPRGGAGRGGAGGGGGGAAGGDNVKLVAPTRDATPTGGK